MGMHKSASTGTGMNMAFGSGGAGMSGSQSTNSSLGGGIGPVPKADPFADLGQSAGWALAGPLLPSFAF